jgi:hypothetical protein
MDGWLQRVAMDILRQQVCCCLSICLVDQVIAILKNCYVSCCCLLICLRRAMFGMVDFVRIGSI